MNKKFAFLPIFATVFIDLLGVGIVIPILAPLFINPESSILPANLPINIRAILFGSLVAAYPLAQFFGAPLLGGFSDRLGRRKILLVSLVGTLFGYIIFAIGILTKNIPFLFISRLLDGFTGGNIAIAQSAISDLSSQKDKAKNFGMIGTAFGLGFILGPYIGGKLADPSIVSWFNSSTPFWFAALLAFINILLVFAKFPETLKIRIKTKISIMTGFTNIKRAFGMPNLRVMFSIVFLLTLGFSFFSQFFPVLLVDKFNFSEPEIGDIFAYMGIWIALTQGAILRPISKRLKPSQILSFSIFLMGITFFLLLIPNKSLDLYLFLPFLAIFQGLTQPNVTAIISNLSTKESQGEILGIKQSIQSLGMATPPIIAGFIVAINTSLPTIIAGILTISAWVIFIFFLRKKRRQQLSACQQAG
jgi:DHA1 family tetracycline resistance protein-like MFS transporter